MVCKSVAHIKWQSPSVTEVCGLASHSEWCNARLHSWDVLAGPLHALVSLPLAWAVLAGRLLALVALPPSCAVLDGRLLALVTLPLSVAVLVLAGLQTLAALV